jgi:ribokinase
MATPIYVIGSSNTDMVIKSERLPAPGETIIGGTFLMNPGGKGANQAVAAARLGGNVSFVANINIDFVLLDESEPSGVALINVDAKGENTIVVASGSNGNLTPLKLEPFFKSLQSNAIVLLQFEIPLDTVEFIIRQCSTKSIRVIVNPAPANKIHETVWKHVFAVTPNESEAELITRIKIDDEVSIQAAAKNLLDKGVQQVIITLGKRGAYWCNKDGNGFVPAPKVNAVDTTAAGDCFNGAFAVAIAEGMSMHDAVNFACQAASISVTLMGAQASMPYRSEIV